MVPTEEKIAEAVKKLWRNRSGEPSGILTEHLKGWFATAKRGKMTEEKGEEKTEAEEEGRDLWGKVVEITQTAFREGKLEEEAMWQTVVLIPKGEKEYRGVGMLEVTWKVVVVILHRRLTTAITLHDTLQGFREGCGTGTATLIVGYSH